MMHPCARTSPRLSSLVTWQFARHLGNLFMLATVISCFGDLPSVEPGPANPLTSADPGVFPIHRLNNSEYNNTVRDLLMTQQTPANAFPPDPQTNGFDNNAATLGTSPSSVLAYELAAEALAAEAANPASAWYQNFVPCPQGTAQRTCLTQFVTSFGLRAWRRPLTSVEATAMVAMGEQAAAGSSLPDQVQALIVAFLVAPDFLFRIEYDANANSTAAHRVSGYELASRLSYFIWSSTPDSALLAAAADGSILTPAGLAAQTERLLADWRAGQLVTNFSGQWLNLRNIPGLAFDPTQFPAWNPALATAAVGQTMAFMQDVFSGQTSAAHLFDADYTYLNDSLASLYGLPAVGASQLQRTTTPLPQVRRGLLGQAAVLASTSFPTRTSPVRRGEFLLEQVLCVPVPPPPANAGPLPTITPTSGTQRQVLSAHIANPACASCHALMDPYGFALEPFNAIGAWRTTDNGLPIDASATLLPGNQVVQGPADLAKELSQDPRVPACLTSNLYTYALGRTPEASDTAPLAALQTGYIAGGQNLKAFITSLVAAPIFSMRRGGT